jgi:hypothetical protein
VPLSEKARNEIKAALEAYPQRRTAVLPALRAAQRDAGYLGPEQIDEVAELVGLDRSGEEVALPEVAAELLQRLELLAALDALGDDVHAEPLRELDDRLEDRRGLPHAEAVDEAAVDLQDVDRELLHVAER